MYHLLRTKTVCLKYIFWLVGSLPHLCVIHVLKRIRSSTFAYCTGNWWESLKTRLHLCSCTPYSHLWTLSLKWLQLNWPFLYVWLRSWLSLYSKHVVFLAAGCHFHSLLHCLDLLFVFLSRFHLLLFHLIGPTHLLLHVLEHRGTVWTPNKINKASKFYSQTTI